MKKTRVLVVDDSVIIRRLLSSILAEDPTIEVVGVAANGRIALQKMDHLQPDLVTLDVSMPDMDGLETLTEIRKTKPALPVIMFSTLTERGAEETLEALARGASDYVAKPANVDNVEAGMDSVRKQLLPKIKALCSVRTPLMATPRRTPVNTGALGGSPAGLQRCDLVVIGSSTGGVEALQAVLSRFPENCPPTVIVQHVNPRFAAAIAKTLDLASPANVQLAEHGMPMRPGTVYLAPGGERHLAISGSAQFNTRLVPGDPVSGHRPSVDVLFQSVAETAGRHAVGILLTGMGSDGARGLLAMAQAGAHTIAQDQATCTVFGMPKAAISLGAAGVVSPLELIAQHALKKAA